MKADILNPKALFQKDVRYVIPTFQRPYVWNQDDQWEPLWNDVRNTAEEYIEELARAGDNEAVAEAKVLGHFLGAVVLQQQLNAARELETRHVIDGQQRLTTIQLLLDAAQDVFEQDGFSKEARQLRKLVLNDPEYAEDNPEFIFKIWPTLGDQEGFRRAMHNELVIDGYEDQSIVQAHEFFKLQTRQWLEVPEDKAIVRAHALSTTLMGLLRMVVIDLETRDDANVIFETLNARGTPLLASDLVKNWIFHAASQTGLDSEAVHRKYWTGFEESWWRDEVRQGRVIRPRLDTYLNYWLIMRTAEEVQVADVFPRFRKHAERLADVTAILEDLQDVATSFKALEGDRGATRLAQFLYRWRVMDAGVSTPVILWLIDSRPELGEERFERSLAAIESYLIRRMICRLTTKDYNRLFLDLMALLKEAPSSHVDTILTEHLAGQTSESRVWPSNGQTEEALLSLPLYQLLTRGRLRLILEGVEDSYRSPKTEEDHVKRGLSIEHIMPQGWRSHWQPVPLLEAEASRRDRLIHTLGNLTLVKDRLNTELSNAPWSDKTTILGDHTVLLLNRRLLKDYPDGWSEATIAARGAELAERVLKLWPRP
ncbi:MAG: DUF262 domain-containing protein [Chloroflexi bacterium]|nr:DUF262 domain-containing protein [Chloroflexota bacterium]